MANARSATRASFLYSTTALLSRPLVTYADHSNHVDYIGPLTGEFVTVGTAQLEGFKRGVKAAATRLKQKIEPLFDDDGADARTARLKATKAIENGAPVLAGGVTLQESKALATSCAEMGVPFIAIGLRVQDGSADGPSLYRLNASFMTSLASQFAYVIGTRPSGMKNARVIVVDDASLPASVTSTRMDLVRAAAAAAQVPIREMLPFSSVHTQDEVPIIDASDVIVLGSAKGPATLGRIPRTVPVLAGLLRIDDVLARSFTMFPASTLFTSVWNPALVDSKGESDLLGYMAGVDIVTRMARIGISNVRSTFESDVKAHPEVAQGDPSLNRQPKWLWNGRNAEQPLYFGRIIDKKFIVDAKCGDPGSKPCKKK